MVSAPFRKFSFLNKCNILALYHYNPLTMKYEKESDISQMKPGIGYWAYASEKCNFIFDGNDETTIYDSGDYFNGEMVKGWNQIGGSSMRINLRENRGSCVFSDIYAFDANAQKYYKTNIIEKGKGYWFYTTNNCNFRPGDMPVFDVNAAVILNDASFPDENEKNAYSKALEAFSPVMKIPVSDANYNNLMPYDAVIITHEYPELSKNTLLNLANNGPAIILLGDARNYLNDINKPDLNNHALVFLYEK